MCVVGLMLHVLAGVVDRSGHQVQLQFELVHVLALTIMLLVAAVGFGPLPDLTVAMVVPAHADRSTMFVMEGEGERTREVFVNPSSGAVLGSRIAAGGIVGLANRLHGFLNNESMTVPLPTAVGVFGADPAFADIAIGEIVLEVFACWALVLVVTGLYLWFPRKKGAGEALFVPRIAKPGRARWRDLHAIPGMLLCVVALFFIVTGLPWSASWGENWRYAAQMMTPNAKPTDAVSIGVTLGALNRYGIRIPWAAAESPVAASGASTHHGDDAVGDEKAPAAGSDVPRPATVSLDSVIRVAAGEERFDRHLHGADCAECAGNVRTFDGRLS